MSRPFFSAIASILAVTISQVSSASDRRPIGSTQQVAPGHSHVVHSKLVQDEQ